MPEYEITYCDLRSWILNGHGFLSQNAKNLNIRQFIQLLRIVIGDGEKGVAYMDNIVQNGNRCHFFNKTNVDVIISRITKSYTGENVFNVLVIVLGHIYPFYLLVELTDTPCVKSIMFNDKSRS